MMITIKLGLIVKPSLFCTVIKPFLSIVKARVFAFASPIESSLIFAS